ncbi:hypothetical protein EDC96DRAFT_544064 [Choanephora cucurbitarum]|nr:hypothetical protein EDC96DRAFT_544064 [Choanephora cucurbitarum]
MDSDITFYSEDGRGNIFDDNGNEAAVYDEALSFRLKKITDLKKLQNVSENFGYPSCSFHFDTVIELGYHLDESYTAKPRAEVEESFRVLRNNDKWDSVYWNTSELQIGDQSSQSLIFDPGDSELCVKNDVFTEEEIEEIKAYKNFKSIQLPDDTKHWEECYDREKHFDLDWIKHSVYTLVREHENGSLKKDHLENWYNIHLWFMIDHIFGNLEGLEIIRTIEDVNNHTRQPMGRRFDYLICQINPNSSSSLEFGASEVDKIDKLNGNKMIKERGTKLPKVLKDMLDLLVKENEGVVHSGLHMKVIRVDRPKGYITRITDGKALQVPTDITKFGENVLPVLVQVYCLKLLVKDTFESVNKDQQKRRVFKSSPSFRHVTQSILFFCLNPTLNSIYALYVPLFLSTLLADIEAIESEVADFLIWHSSNNGHSSELASVFDLSYSIICRSINFDGVILIDSFNWHSEKWSIGSQKDDQFFRGIKPKGYFVCYDH